MNILRFIFPFLFVRNWHDGHWELSRVRCVFFIVLMLFLSIGFGIAYMLHLPVLYTV